MAGLPCSAGASSRRCCRRSSAFWLYRFEINIRAAGVLGIVGAGGIGALLANTLFYRRWDKAGMAVLVIIIATILIDQASGWVRRRIIEGSAAPPSRRGRRRAHRATRSRAAMAKADTRRVLMSERFILRDRGAREAEEAVRLAPAAFRSVDSRGRARPEAPDAMRTAFERDRDRIMHSKAFRRLKHKTQVFVNPEGDHYVTRLTHTIQVTQIARSLAAALSLNESLAEAIGLGHDVGHSPFGHTGEEALSPYFPTTGGWHHAAQSVRIYEVLEDLNLSWEVRDGIRAHSWKIDPPPATQEALCVRYADRIAYLTHDALDALRAGVLTADAVPPGHDRPLRRARLVLGRGHDRRGHRRLARVSGEVRMDDDVLADMNELRDFMFERVYLAPAQRAHQAAAIEVIRRLMDHHLGHPEDIPTSYRDNDADRVTQATDYIAGMTDRFALRTHERLYGSDGMDDATL